MENSDIFAKEGLATSREHRTRGQSQHPGAGRPFFVVGCERSGTTLLTVMLGRHREIAMMPETHFFLRVVPGRAGRSDRPTTHEEILRRFRESPRAEDIGLDAEEIQSRFTPKAPTYPELFSTLLELYAEQWNKPLAGEKTPFHLLRVPLILRWFPEARIVCIVRDGRDVVRSILDAPWTAHRSLRRQAWKWTKCSRLARRYLHDYPRQFEVVRYEDLVRDPETVLRRVNAFYGVDFDAAQLAAGGASPAVPAHEQSWKANAVERPDESRISAWRQHATVRERLIMNSLMEKELRTFGYEETERPKVSVLQGARNAALNMLCKAGIYRLAGNVYRYAPGLRQLWRAREARHAPAAEGAWEEEMPGAESGITHSAA